MRLSVSIAAVILNFPLLLPLPVLADDDDELRRYKRQAQQDRWAAEEETSKLRRRVQNLENEASESRQERTGPVYLRNGGCIWNFGNNIYGKC